MKKIKRILKSSVFLCALCGATFAAQAANRPISQTWDVRNGPDRRMPIRWFAGESVAFDLQPKNGRTPVDLSGATVIWEVLDWDNPTNLFVSATGTVSGATASFVLTPEQSNLEAGTYNGYVRAVVGETERVVLVWQTIKVVWSPSSGNYRVVDGVPTTYSTAEIDALVAAQAAGILNNEQGILDIEGRTNVWNSAYGWGDHAGGGYLTRYTETDPAWTSQSGAVYSAIGLKLDATASNQFATAAQGDLAGLAYGWGDHAGGGYLTSYTETDPAWTSQSGAVYSAIGLKFDTSSTNQFATSAQGDLADTAMQKTAPSQLISSSAGSIALDAAGDIDLLGGSINMYGNMVMKMAATIISDPADSSGLFNRGYADGRFATTAQGAKADNAIPPNSPILIANDSTWTGWTTTGTMTDGKIFLTLGQYLLSPVQSNGIAHVDADVWSGANATASDVGIYTNGVPAIGAAPWRADNGQWRIEAGGTLPGGTPGVHVDSAIITSYTDLAEAASPKTVANLGMIDNPVDPTDVANMRYVDAEDQRERDYAANQLLAYAADADKTVRGSELRLGNMWVVSPADASGDRFIVSGGEISGDGELVGTTTEFVVSKNGYPLLSFESDSSGLFITNFNISATSSNATVTLMVATNGVHSAPFAEWTDHLVVGEWSRVLTYTTETYPAQTDGYYTLEFTVPATNSAFFRSMQDEGDSVMRVLADVLDLGGSPITNVSTLTAQTVAAQSINAEELNVGKMRTHSGVIIFDKRISSGIYIGCAYDGGDSNVLVITYQAVADVLGGAPDAVYLQGWASRNEMLNSGELSAPNQFGTAAGVGDHYIKIYWDGSVLPATATGIQWGHSLIWYDRPWSTMSINLQFSGTESSVVHAGVVAASTIGGTSRGVPYNGEFIAPSLSGDASNPSLAFLGFPVAGGRRLCLFDNRQYQTMPSTIVITASAESPANIKFNF